MSRKYVERSAALPDGRASDGSEFDDDTGRRENRQNPIELTEHAPVKAEKIESYKAEIFTIQQVQDLASEGELRFFE